MAQEELERQSRKAETREKISTANKGRVFSDEHRERLRQAKLGGHHSEETRAKMSASRTGRRLSDEHRAKISAARKGWVPSQETRDKMSAAKLGKPGRKLSNEGLAKMIEGRRASRTAAET